MKLTKLMTVFVATTMLTFGASAAMADGGGSSAGAVAGASAGAVANGGTTKNYAFGSAVGAAECANALALGPIGGSWTDDTCKHERVANYWAKRGNFAMADQVMLNEPISARAYKQQQPKFEKIGYSACWLEGRTPHVRLVSGLSDANKKAAVAACVASLK